MLDKENWVLFQTTSCLFCLISFIKSREQCSLMLGTLIISFSRTNLEPLQDVLFLCNFIFFFSLNIHLEANPKSTARVLNYAPVKIVSISIETSPLWDTIGYFYSSILLSFPTLALCKNMDQTDLSLHPIKANNGTSCLKLKAHMPYNLIKVVLLQELSD